MITQRFEAIAEQYLTVVLRGPVEYMCACPLCDGDASLQFNTEKGLWTCFRCGQGGTAERLVKLIGGTYSDPAVSVEVLQTALDRLKTSFKDYKPQTILEDSYLLRFEGDSPNGYWKSRGFNAATRENWGLGFDPILDRCTIAYRNTDGQLLGVIQRRLDNDFPRYIYPKGFDRGGNLFGSWKISASRGDEVALVEGSTDCIALGRFGITAVAQYGSSITARQIRLLKRLGINSIILFYDFDEAGRKAEQQALENLSGFFVYKVMWDESKYCWHKKLCGCSLHTWKTINQCKKKLFCQCGLKHDMDPGKLTEKEIKFMVGSSVLVGKRKALWHTKKFVR